MSDITILRLQTKSEIFLRIAIGFDYYILLIFFDDGTKVKVPSEIKPSLFCFFDINQIKAIKIVSW